MSMGDWRLCECCGACFVDFFVFCFVDFDLDERICDFGMGLAIFFFFFYVDKEHITFACTFFFSVRFYHFLHNTLRRYHNTYWIPLIISICINAFVLFLQKKKGDI